MVINIHLLYYIQYIGRVLHFCIKGQHVLYFRQKAPPLGNVHMLFVSHLQKECENLLILLPSAGSGSHTAVLPRRDKGGERRLGGLVVVFQLRRMSWSLASSLIKPLQQWYSEINSATLTGAIDVVVVEHEDGNFVSSPFHVRFGKMGVLKAREKIVDIEVNDEPVEIHMKLDEFGVAFFVEDLSDDEDDDVPPELATSPIPGSDPDASGGVGIERNSSVNRSLLEDFNAVEEVGKEETKEDEEGKEAASPDKPVHGHKGKLNRKKRKRRQNMRHSRNSSRTSLKEITGSGQQQQEQDRESSESSSADSSGGAGTTCKTSMTASADNLDVEDNDGDDETDTPVNSFLSSTSTPLVKIEGGKSLPHLQLDQNQNSTAAPPRAMSATQSFTSQKSDENSFLLSRLGRESINNILDSQELKKESRGDDEAGRGQDDPVMVGSAPGRMDYYSEPEMSPITSPIGSRPATPILSDSEYETKQRGNQSTVYDADRTQQSWEWGQMPTSAAQAAVQAAAQGAAHGRKASTDAKAAAREEGEQDEKSKDSKRYRSWTFSLWSKSKETEEQGGKAKDAPGVYLDDIKDDQEMLSIYVGSSSHRDRGGVGLGRDHLLAIDDDAESGNGPSLPMSPHSVEGAVGGPRIRYDSSDDDQKNSASGTATFRAFSDIAISLCGGLDPDDDKKEVGPKETFSPTLFEQSIISYDDFEMHLRNPASDLFSNPNLVVRAGDHYYRWPDAVPVIMSALLYGRQLPADLVRGTKATSAQADGREGEGVSSKDMSPNSKTISRSSSWWPWRRGEEEEGENGKVPNALGEMQGDFPVGEEVGKAVKATAQDDDAKGLWMDAGMPPKVEEAEEKGKKQQQENNNSSEEGESDPDLHALNEGVRSRRRYKKTLRLSSKNISSLGLKPGMNEVQFSVTTAYQGTTRCRCHVYWWRSTDKIVISDIDGTITKSDVLGHVLPIIGRDWAQSGVASLFTKIVANGYHVAYLSARAIGQASITKDYLKSISQGDVNLPDGPLFLNPTSLVNAFHREVIEKKPEKFKIACLRDVQRLFPEGRNPFYAGYGNRVNVS